MSLFKLWEKLESTSSKDRLQYYKKMAKCLGDKSSKSVNGKQTLSIVPIVEDLESGSVDLKVNVLHFLGLLLSKDNSGILSSEQKTNLRKCIAKSLHDGNVVISRKILWCLSQGSFSEIDVKMLSEIVTGLDVITQTPKTVMYLYEALSFLQKLLKEYKGEMEEAIQNISKFIFQSSCHPASKIREVASPLVELCLPQFTKYRSKVSPVLLKLLKSTLQKDMLHLFDHKQEKYVFSIWCHVVNLLGTDLHIGASTINILMEIAEKGFKSSNEETLKYTFGGWLALIKNFALNIDVLSNPKKLQFLLRPLKLRLKNTKNLTSDVFNTFWFLAVNLKDKLSSNFEQVCMPLLEFLLPSVKDNVNLSLTPKEDATDPKENVNLALELLLRLLEQPARPNFPKGQMPLLFTSPLEVPMPISVILRHFKKIVKAFKIILKSGITLEKKDLAENLFHSLVYIISHVSEDSGRDNVDAVNSFLNLLADVINNHFCSPEFCVEILEKSSKFPQRMLISHCYHLGNSGVMNDNLAISLMTILLKPYILINCSDDTKLLPIFQHLCNACFEGSLSPLAYAQTFLHIIDSEDVRNNCQPLTLLNMWTLIVTPLLSCIEKTQEVNQGDSLDNDFSCMYEVLLYPISSFLPPKVIQVRFKPARKLWLDLYKIFIRCSSLISSVEENSVCEHFCREMKKKIKREVSSQEDATQNSESSCLLPNQKVMDESYLMAICQFLQVVVECIDFTSAAENNSNSEGWFLKQKQKPIGNLTSVVQLIEFVLQTMNETFSSAISDSNLKEQTKNKTTKSTLFCQSLDLVKSLICGITNPAMLPTVLETLAIPLSHLFVTSTANKTTMAPFAVKLENMWKSVVASIQLVYKGPFDTEFLCILSPLLESTLLSHRKGIHEKSKQFWLASFAPNQSTLKFPDTLKEALIKSKLLLSDISLSDSHMLDTTSVSLNDNTVDKEEQLTPVLEPIKAQKPVKTPPSSTKKTPEKRFFKMLNELPEENFVVIPPSTSLPSTRRKSVRKSFVPALYNDLSQNSNAETYSQSLPDSNNSEQCVEELPVQEISKCLTTTPSIVCLSACPSVPSESPGKKQNTKEVIETPEDEIPSTFTDQLPSNAVDLFESEDIVPSSLNFKTNSSQKTQRRASVAGEVSSNTSSLFYKLSFKSRKSESLSSISSPRKEFKVHYMDASNTSPSRARVTDDSDSTKKISTMGVNIDQETIKNVDQSIEKTEFNHQTKMDNAEAVDVDDGATTKQTTKPEKATRKSLRIKKAIDNSSESSNQSEILTGKSVEANSPTFVNGNTCEELGNNSNLILESPDDHHQVDETSQSKEHSECIEEASNFDFTMLSVNLVNKGEVILGNRITRSKKVVNVTVEKTIDTIKDTDNQTIEDNDKQATTEEKTVDHANNNTNVVVIDEFAVHNNFDHNNHVDEPTSTVDILEPFTKQTKKPFAGRLTRTKKGGKALIEDEVIVIVRNDDVLLDELAVGQNLDIVNNVDIPAETTESTKSSMEQEQGEMLEGRVTRSKKDTGENSIAELHDIIDVKHNNDTETSESTTQQGLDSSKYMHEGRVTRSKKTAKGGNNFNDETGEQNSNSFNNVDNPALTTDIVSPIEHSEKPDEGKAITVVKAIEITIDSDDMFSASSGVENDDNVGLSEPITQDAENSESMNELSELEIDTIKPSSQQMKEQNETTAVICENNATEPKNKVIDAMDSGSMKNSYDMFSSNSAEQQNDVEPTEPVLEQNLEDTEYIEKSSNSVRKTSVKRKKKQGKRILKKKKKNARNTNEISTKNSDLPENISQEVGEITTDSNLAISHAEDEIYEILESETPIATISPVNNPKKSPENLKEVSTINSENILIEPVILLQKLSPDGINKKLLEFKEESKNNSDSPGNGESTNPTSGLSNEIEEIASCSSGQLDPSVEEDHREELKPPTNPQPVAKKRGRKGKPVKKELPCLKRLAKCNSPAVKSTFKNLKLKKTQARGKFKILSSIESSDNSFKNDSVFLSNPSEPINVSSYKLDENKNSSIVCDISKPAECLVDTDLVSEPLLVQDKDNSQSPVDKLLLIDGNVSEETVKIHETRENEMISNISTTSYEESIVNEKSKLCEDNIVSPSQPMTSHILSTVSLSNICNFENANGAELDPMILADVEQVNDSITPELVDPTHDVQNFEVFESENPDVTELDDTDLECKEQDVNFMCRNDTKLQSPLIVMENPNSKEGLVTILTKDPLCELNNEIETSENKTFDQEDDGFEFRIGDHKYSANNAYSSIDERISAQNSNGEQELYPIEILETLKDCLDFAENENSDQQCNNQDMVNNNDITAIEAECEIVSLSISTLNDVSTANDDDEFRSSICGAKERKNPAPVRSPILSRLRQKKHRNSIMTKHSIKLFKDQNFKDSLIRSFHGQNNEASVERADQENNTKENAKASTALKESKQSSPLLFTMSNFSRSKRMLQASQQHMSLLGNSNNDQKTLSPSSVLASNDGSPVRNPPVLNMSVSGSPVLSSRDFISAKRLVYSDISTLPSTSILKRRNLDSTIKTMQKTVHFADPLVEERYIESPKRIRPLPVRHPRKRKATAIATSTPSGPTSSIKIDKDDIPLVFCPAFLNCSEPVKDLLDAVLSFSESTIVGATLAENHVETVSELFKLTNNDLKLNQSLDFQTLQKLANHWLNQSRHCCVTAFTVDTGSDNDNDNGQKNKILICSSNDCQQCVAIKKAQESEDNVQSGSHLSDTGPTSQEAIEVDSDESKENELSKKPLSVKDLVDTLLLSEDDGQWDDIPPLKLIRLQSKICLVLERKEKKRLASLALKENSVASLSEHT